MTPAQSGTGQLGTGRPGQAGQASRLLAVNFAVCLLLLVQYLLAARPVHGDPA